MSDRELLELAAKAAGLPVDMTNEGGIGWFACGKSDDGETVWWNPLKSDGDALRLAVDLDLNVFHAANCAYAMSSENDESNEQRVSYAGAGDKYKATRIAIVRAAAEIARAALAQEGS
ncbi:hypothetical protein ACMHYO_11595 [Allopusillimonas ginsengisoli]|uniref:hypothetical protein n=1 Tax=Allopusillimonas ginsengisoli TaxID=453575 RepID=UPI0039C445FF